MFQKISFEKEITSGGSQAGDLSQKHPVLRSDGVRLYWATASAGSGGSVVLGEAPANHSMNIYMITDI